MVEIGFGESMKFAGSAHTRPPGDAASATIGATRETCSDQGGGDPPCADEERDGVPST
jgi:hypothetical protein